MKYERQNHAICLIQNEVFVFGGRNQTEFVEETLEDILISDFGETLNLHTNRVEEFYFTEAL